MVGLGPQTGLRPRQHRTLHSNVNKNFMPR